MAALLWRVTPAQVTRYTEGDCWLLAFEMGRLLNAPLVSLCDPTDRDDWHHVAVDLGRETLLDAIGVHSRDELSSAWETHTGGPVVLRELGFFHDLDSYLMELDGERRLAGFVSWADEEDARQLAHEIARALTEDTHDHANNHLHGWTTRRRQEQVGA